VLALDARLLEVLVGASPTFDKLRNPLLRKTMSRLATVEQAARVAGIDANDLLERLNRAVSDDSRGGAAPAPARAAAPTVPDAGPPEFVTKTAPDRVVELDVREDLRAGREPFRRILDAARRLRDDEVLRLRAIFEPAPLYAVLGRQGLDHYTERLADDDWVVWFHRSAAPVATPEVHAPAAPEDDADVVVIDVRGLEPPDPMMRTFEALERLPRGKTLVQINVRVPQFMLPQLAARGFVYEVREQSPDLVRIFIRHTQP
ncbi:MAG TPA: DUF2249 domain-containing protein, partial [Polyangiaceae bacterium]|nr:DUF2249 domain-containing protein [Polyangiaceae bacterium]